MVHRYTYMCVCKWVCKTKTKYVLQAHVWMQVSACVFLSHVYTYVPYVYACTYFFLEKKFAPPHTPPSPRPSLPPPSPSHTRPAYARLAPQVPTASHRNNSIQVFYLPKSPTFNSNELYVYKWAHRQTTHRQTTLKQLCVTGILLCLNRPIFH